MEPNWQYGDRVRHRDKPNGPVMTVTAVYRLSDGRYVVRCVHTEDGQVVNNDFTPPEMLESAE